MLLFSCLLNVLNCMKEMSRTTSYEAKQKMSAGVQTCRVFLVFNNLFDLLLFMLYSTKKSLQIIILDYNLK